MNHNLYRQFTNGLLENVAGDKRVVGLVALGSMAAQDYQPDEWSDHDFFLIVEPGEQEAFRSDLGWLPGSKRIVLSYRETAHGLKVLYDPPHLLEFAVFELAELQLARINRYRVLLDRGRLEEKLVELKEATTASTSHCQDDLHHLGQILTILYVGVGRHRRGERLSGHHFVRMSALYHLVPMIVRHVPSPKKSILDNLDPFRRFDFAYPEIAVEIGGLLHLPVPGAATGLLDLVERELKPHVKAFPDAAFALVRKAITEG